MSRTFRYIPLFYRSVSPWEKTQIGLQSDLHPLWLYDPRDKLQNGYDNGKGQTYLYSHFPIKGWGECYNQAARKKTKRTFHKSRRAYQKRQMFREERGEEWSSP